MTVRFYAPAHLEEVYSERAEEIKEEILEVFGHNGWDKFTSLESVEEFIDFLSIIE